MADRVFERVLNQTSAGVAVQQEQHDPELRRRKAQVRQLGLYAAKEALPHLFCMLPATTASQQYHHSIRCWQMAGHSSPCNALPLRRLAPGTSIVSALARHAAAAAPPATLTLHPPARCPPLPLPAHLPASLVTCPGAGR